MRWINGKRVEDANLEKLIYKTIGTLPTMGPAMAGHMTKFIVEGAPLDEALLSDYNDRRTMESVLRSTLIHLMGPPA